MTFACGCYHKRLHIDDLAADILEDINEALSRSGQNIVDFGFVKKLIVDGISSAASSVASASYSYKKSAGAVKILSIPGLKARFIALYYDVAGERDENFWIPIEETRTPFEEKCPQALEKWIMLTNVHFTSRRGFN